MAAVGLRALGRADDLAGAAIERATRRHHQRRLAKLGHAAAFGPPAGGWAETGAFAPRAGSRVEVLVDGEEALARIAGEIEGARSHVHVAGWHFSPGFRVGDGGPTLRELLAEAAQRVDVRVLCWAGAPLPLFHPDRREVRRMRDELVGGTRISMALDATERPFHCHHEKLVLVDDRVAFVGGIDLTDFAGNRLDSSGHPPRDGLGWHDAVTRVEGPVVADVAAHFLLRWRSLADDGAPDPAAQVPLEGGIEAQLVRTVPERVYDGCRGGEFTILESYVRALRAADRFIHLESQFLWSPEITAVLCEKLRRPPRDEFRLLVLLPAHPNNGGDDTRGQLGQLALADGKGGGPQRFLACTLHQPGPGGRPVYVHAKVGIVDDEWLTVGSANLNEHSLFNDTEVNVVVREPELARATRLRLWSEHLERDAAGDPAALFDEVWLPLAEEQARLRKRQGWAPHRLSQLPNVSRRARAFLGPINGLLVDG